MIKATSRLLDLVPAVRPPCPAERFARAESFVAATGARIIHGERGRYNVRGDVIAIPPRRGFDDPAAYYGVLTHELIHWTRHPSRLDRDFGRREPGDYGYAMEELVAGIGALFLAADLRLPPADHCAYIGAWLQVCEADEGETIRIATRHAEDAIRFLKDAACRRGWG